MATTEPWAPAVEVVPPPPPPGWICCGCVLRGGRGGRGLLGGELGGCGCCGLHLVDLLLDAAQHGLAGLEVGGDLLLGRGALGDQRRGLLALGRAGRRDAARSASSGP